MNAKRLDWVDVVKGIGILLVVEAHVVHSGLSYYSAWFYMPLFFFLSGYLLRIENTATADFVRKRVRHLLLPYFAYMAALGVIVYALYRLATLSPDGSMRMLLEYVGRLLYGGLALGGVFGYLGQSFGVFWFPTCLFLTQIIFYLAFRMVRGRQIALIVVVAALYALAMVDSSTGLMCKSFWKWGLPWNLHVAALGVFYFFAGHVTRRAAESEAYRNSKPLIDTLILVIPAFFLVAAVILDKSGVIHPNLKGMKFSHYGIPVYGTLISLACIALVSRAASFIARLGGTLRGILVEFGAASMVIMYIHQFIAFTMKDYPATANPWLGFAAALTISYCCYRLFLLMPWTRRVFLGSL